MSEIFLRSVEFSNFRIYGDSYAFEFPNGPGISLITGGNGLGKTSFFDGLEWALTNQVGRFNDIHVDGRRKNYDPLTRVGALEKSHRVSLEFSDGSIIDRGAGFDVSEEEVIRLLKRPDWADISSLSGYLSITHFFGQTSAQRFSMRKPSDQWEALKGPAGVDRINALRERMSGLGVKRAFTKVIEDRIAKLDQARLDLVVWNELTGERDRARQLSSSENAIQPSELHLEAENLANQIIKVTGQGSWTGALEIMLPENTLGAVSTLLNSAMHDAVLEMEKIEGLMSFLSDFESGRSEASALSGDIEKSEARLNLAKDQLKQAETSLMETVERLRVSELEANSYHNRLIALGRVADSVKQLNEATARQAELATLLNFTESALSDAAARVASLRDEYAFAAGQRSERRELANRMSLARTRFQVSQSQVRLQFEIERVVQMIADKNPVALREKRTVWIAEEAIANERVADLTSKLREHDDRSRAILEAATAIAHRLDHNDTTCPVCATTFAPGDLLAIVKDQRKDDSTSASSLATDLAELRLEIEHLTRQLAQANHELAEVANLEKTLASHQSQEAELSQQLVEAGGAPHTIYSESEIAEIEEQLRDFDDFLEKGLSVEDLAVGVSEAEATLSAEMAKRSSVIQLQTQVNEEIQSCKSHLVQYPNLWNSETGVLIDLLVEREFVERAASDAGAAISQVKSELLSKHLEREARHEAEVQENGVLTRANARLSTLALQLEAGRRRWADAGQSGEPDPARLTSYRHLKTEAFNKLKSIQVGLEQLTIRYRKWLNDERLRKLEDDISRQMEASHEASEYEYQASLIKRVESAQDELTLAQAAKEKVDHVGSSMQDLARNYADRVLEPLNATINRFARMMMTLSETEVTYKAEHHVTRSELRPNIIRSEPDGSTSRLDMNPSLYFSEGQLSALSVAALFAASTTFGWSRWRGLLLDDPLQHNDVIHASAFMDLLRQMVLGLNYQVILSTHDSAEAEFLIRKCRSAGIPYCVHELGARGAAGLVQENASNAISTREFKVD